MPEAITGIKLDDLEAVLKEESATAITNQVNEVVPVANTAEPEAVVESDHKWVKAVTLFLQSAGIDINIDEPQWKQSLEVAVQTFSELDEDNQNNFRIDAYTWLTEWLSNPQSSLADALSTEAVIHFIAIFSQARFLRKSAQNKQLEQFKDKLNNLNREAIKPAQPDEPASEPSTLATESSKTPKEQESERETWKKQVQDFFDSVGLKGSHLINLSKDNQDSAILSLQKKDPQARQQLLTEAEAWLAQPLDVLRIDLNESHQQQALAVLVIETTSLTQAQRAQLNKLRVALLVAQDPTSSLLINQLDRIHSANKKAIVEALRVQLTEDEPSDGLMRDICQVLSTLAIKDSGGAAGVPAVDALQSLEKTHWGVIVQYLEQITTGAARTDTAAQALQVIARHEDSVRWQRVLEIALDSNTQLGVRNKAVEYLVENNEWDEVKTFVERARGRKELKTVVGFAQRSLEEAGVAPPSETPVTFGLGEEQSSAAPAPDSTEPPTPEPENTHRQKFEQVIQDFLKRGDDERSTQAAMVAEILADHVSSPSLELLFGQEAVKLMAEGGEQKPIQFQDQILQLVTNRTLSALGITEASWQAIATEISDRLPVGRSLNFGFTNQATLGHLREALVQQGFLDVVTKPAEVQRIVPDFDPQTAAEGLMQTVFAEDKMKLMLSGEDVAEIIVAIMASDISDPDLLRERVAATIHSQPPTGSNNFIHHKGDLTDATFNFISFSSGLLTVLSKSLGVRDGEVLALKEDMRLGDYRGRFEQVVQRLHQELLKRSETEKPVEEPVKEAEFDAQKVAAELLASSLDTTRTAENVTSADIAMIAIAIYRGLIPDLENVLPAVMARYQNEGEEILRRDAQSLFDSESDVEASVRILGNLFVISVGNQSNEQKEVNSNARKRLQALYPLLHAELLQRDQSGEGKSVTKEPVKQAEFDARAVAEELASRLFTPDNVRVLQSASEKEWSDLTGEIVEQLVLSSYFRITPDPQSFGIELSGYLRMSVINEPSLGDVRAYLLSSEGFAEKTVQQLVDAVKECIHLGTMGGGKFEIVDGADWQTGHDRLVAVFSELHIILSERQSQVEPDVAAFDAAAVAQELANNVFAEGKAIENVSAADMGKVASAAYDGVVKDTSKFSEHFVKKLEGNQSVLFLCRDMLYESGTKDATIVELLSSQLATLIVSNGFELAEGADWQTGHDRFAQVLTELHRFISERKSQAEPKTMSQLMGERYRNALAATNLDDNTKSYMDDIAKGDGSFFDTVLYEISLNAQSAEVRAHAAELLEKRKPAGRLPEEIAELAAANRAILIEHAATLLGHNMSGSEAIEGQSRWDSVYYELKAQCENRFDFTYSDEGKERLRTIVFGIFNNLDAMQNDYILRMFPEQSGERGELCAYGFDIEDEQSQRATVEYLIEIAAINGIRSLTDLRRFYGQRFANLTYKLSSENKLSYTPNGERLLNGEASALHFVASVAGINFLAEKGLLTDELLKNADIKTIEKFIQQKRWWDALEVSAIQNQEKSEQKNRLVFTALMDEYGPDFTEEEKAAILKIDSTLLFSQIHTILDLPHAGIDDVLHYEHWQRRFESLCLSLSQACGYGQNAELPAQFNQALNNFMSRIFREEVVVQLTPAERDLPQRIVGVLKTARLTSKLNWVRMRWGLRVDAIDMGLKFSLIRASDVPEVAKAKSAEAEMAGAEEDGDEKASALEEIRDFGLDPSSFETETDEDRATMWATVADAFAELRDLPDDQVDQVAADLAIGLGALGTAGVLPPEELCDDIPYNQATDNLYKLYAQLEAGQEINPELARRALFTFWRSFWSADLPSSEAEMNSFIDKYQETLAVFLGVFAQEGWLNQM